jgi:hypothetical protein
MLMYARAEITANWFSYWRRDPYSDNYGSLRGLVSDHFLHAGVVGDTIVGINALSSVLCVEPQIPNPISLHPRPDPEYT